MEKSKVNSFVLHIIAMASMLVDHIWDIIPNNEWMPYVGRLAFPIFAFMIVEGYYHTRDVKKYMLRLFKFALISEIPFNLLVGGSVVDPFNQNVLFTFLIGLILIFGIEKVKNNKSIIADSLKINEIHRPLFNVVLIVITSAVAVFAGYCAGIVSFADYQETGVLIVLAFYFARGNRWYHKLLQLALMILVNCVLFRGTGFDFIIFGRTVFFRRQNFALFALIPIFLYNGRQGPYNKTIRNIYYWFYPVHMLIIAVLIFLL